MNHKQFYIFILAVTTLLGVLAAAGFYSPAVGALTNQMEETDLTQENPEGNTSFNITSISAGGGHTCALTEGGGVKCWGYNGYGQLGIGKTTTFSSMPVDVVGLTSGISAIATGWYHTCALTTNGGVKCWGSNNNGQLGDGTTTNHNAPVDVSGLTSGVRAITVGHDHTCALMAGGGVKCWGANLSGQLGDGSTTNRLIPVDVVGLEDGATAIAAGWYHTCTLTTNDEVKCWGDNGYGQLGDGTNIDRHTPADVTGLGNGVWAIANGGYHSCALTTDYGVKCWGSNDYGQLGDGTTTSRNTPGDVSGLSTLLAGIAGGGFHTCAITDYGGAKCWGVNWNGQLGDGTMMQRQTPVDVVGLANQVNTITAGGNTTCALVASGRVKCWGENDYGQLGDGSTIDRLTPVDVLLRACYLPTVFLKYCSDFYDEFRNPKSGWPVEDDDYLRAEYLNGEYRVLVKQAGIGFAIGLPTCERQNYVTEVDARWAGDPGESYGLAFGIVGNFDQFYIFEVNTDFQEYAVFHYSPGGKSLIGTSYSGAIHTGVASNHLKVTRNGNYIILEINGEEVPVWYYDSAITGETGAGLIVSSYDDQPNADARFDNFRVKSISSTSAPSSNQVTDVRPAETVEDDPYGTQIPKDPYRQLEGEGTWP